MWQFSYVVKILGNLWQTRGLHGSETCALLNFPQIILCSARDTYLLIHAHNTFSNCDIMCATTLLLLLLLLLLLVFHRRCRRFWPKVRARNLRPLVHTLSCCGTFVQVRPYSFQNCRSHFRLCHTCLQTECGISDLKSNRRIPNPNKAFYAYKTLCKSNLVSRKSKLKLYLLTYLLHGAESFLGS